MEDLTSQERCADALYRRIGELSVETDDATDLLMLCTCYDRVTWGDSGGKNDNFDYAFELHGDEEAEQEEAPA